MMQEIYRLLSVKQSTTSPYHAMVNGLCENVNKTVKNLLKKVVSERPQDWSRYITPLMFAGCLKKAWMECKKCMQNVKRVISSAKEKKQRECASDLNDPVHQKGRGLVWIVGQHTCKISRPYLFPPLRNP